MVFVSNPFLLPVLVLIWSMDVWLWLALIRLVLHRARPGPASTINQAVANITDPLTRLTSRCINHLSAKPMPSWLPWIVTFLIVAITRQVLWSVLLTYQPS